MGSSGAGAGGGGGGGLGGGGAGLGGTGGAGAGHLEVKDGRIVAVDPDAAEAWRAIQGVWSKLSRDWIAFTLGEPGVQAAYRALFRLHVHLTTGGSWDGVARQFGVEGGPGCLVRLVDALVASEGPHATHEKLKAPLKAALLDFTLRLVGDDPVVQERGDGAAVVRALDKGVFARTSNHFLAAYLHQNLRIEGKNLSRTARAHILDYATAKANQIVAAYERNFRAKAWQDVPQASYAHLMQIMAGEPDWSVKRLRSKVNP